MRSIHQIKKELEETEREWTQTRSRLHNEIAEFQSKCPHPDDFLEVEHKDYDDGGPGAPRYESSITKVTCHLCKIVVYSESYNKKRSGEIWKDYRPNARDILNQD